MTFNVGAQSVSTFQMHVSFSFNSLARNNFFFKEICQTGEQFTPIKREERKKKITAPALRDECGDVYQS